MGRIICRLPIGESLTRLQCSITSDERARQPQRISRASRASATRDTTLYRRRVCSTIAVHQGASHGRILACVGGCNISVWRVQVCFLQAAAQRAQAHELSHRSHVRNVTRHQFAQRWLRGLLLAYATTRISHRLVCTHFVVDWRTHHSSTDCSIRQLSSLHSTIILLVHFGRKVWIPMEKI